MEHPAADLSPGKAYHLLCSLVSPRPIAWITSQGPEGVLNAAPFSWFQAVCADPPMVMVAVADKKLPDGGRSLKDTARNVLEGDGTFVVNVARGDQLQALVDTSAPLAPERSEVDAAGLATTPAVAVDVPRIDGCAGWLECRLRESHRYGREGGDATTVLVADVVHLAIADDLLTERGLLDTSSAGVPARLGGHDYLRVTDTFAMDRR